MRPNLNQQCREAPDGTPQATSGGTCTCTADQTQNPCLRYHVRGIPQGSFYRDGEASTSTSDDDDDDDDDDDEFDLDEGDEPALRRSSASLIGPFLHLLQ